MKAIVLCIIFIAGAFASPTDHAEAQFKTLFVDPVIDKLPPDLSGRITNGVEAVPHSIPYQAYLIIADATGSRWLCGGSLISPRHVLTAGHCVDNGVSAVVYLGAHDVRKVESTRIAVESRKLVLHRDYDEDRISNDIGLIVFDEPVELNEYVNVVGLPRRGERDDFVGDNVRVSGWGLVAGDGETSPVLLQVNSTVITNDQCKQVYSIVIDSQLCIAGTRGVGSCNGDSGGPLVHDNSLIGVVSYGAKGCLAGYPSAFTRVTSFLDWIEENTDLRF